MRITTLGDLLLDVIASLDEPLAPDDDRAATTRVTAGGQAANVAAWAASLGAEARLVTKLGDDAAGELVARELRGRGVEVAGPTGGRRVVVSDLGMQRGSVELRSAGPITFGPDGVLYVADNASATIHAIDVGDAGASSGTSC